jgi:uncharacterized phiE125 gp8 family phage protein
MGLALVTAPALEPLGVAEVRQHLRIGSDKVLTPPAAPTVTLVASAGNVTAGERRWRVTFVNVDGESDAGEISAAITTTAGSGQVSITDIPIGDETVTARRIYRTKAGGSVFYRLTTIGDNTTTTHTDNAADGSLGDDVTVDTTIAGWIVAARAFAERELQRPIIAQTWRMTLDAFPCGTDNDIIELLPSLLSVSSVQYVDADGTTQTWSSTNYSVDTDAFPGRVVRGFGVTWPTTRDQRNAVTVTFRAGYGETAANVPGSVKQAMKLLIGLWYSQQLGTNKVDVTNATERAAQALLDPERYLVAA